MQILFERSGGFAGIRMTKSIQSEELPAEEERVLCELVEAAHFFELPAVMRASDRGADRFQYRVTVEGDERKHSIQVDEAAAPPALKALLNWLSAARKP